MMISLPFFKKQNKRKKKYLGLFLKEQSAVLMILTEENGRIFLQEKKDFSYSNSWKSLTEDVNENLTLLMTDEEEINQLIIFTYSHLVDQNNKEINKSLLFAIKKMVSELNFEPLGYIEASEALANFLTERDNLPLTAILIELDVTQLSIFVYKGGQIILKKILSRTDNFIEDLLTVFAEKEKEFLPARIILYNSKDLDNKAEEIVAYCWSEKYFIQIPKVIIIKEEELIKALINIFSDQLKKIDGDVSAEKEVNKLEEKLGFVIGKDILLEQSLVRDKKERYSSDPPSFFSKEKSLFQFKLPAIKMPKLSSFNLSKPLILLFVFLIFLATFFVNELFIHRLTLIIYPPTKQLEKNIKIFGVTDQSTSDYQLNIDVRHNLIKLSATKKTTGENEIGEKARGEVVIYNSNLDTAEKISKGAVLISHNGLKFIFEEEVVVASASGDATDLKPATKKAKVSAYNIGPEYNLAADNKFRIEGKSANLLAKNEIGFSGGTRNKIKTVAKKDLDDLKKELIEQAKTKIIRLEPNYKIITDLTEIDFKSEQYSKELAEEADSITLEAEIDQKFYIYNDDHLKNRLVSLSKKEIPTNFDIEKQKIETMLIKVEKEDENRIILEFKLKGKMVKKILVESLRKEIAFVSKKKAADILKDKFQISRYDFDLRPGLFFFERTPLLQKNIELKIVY